MAGGSAVGRPEAAHADELDRQHRARRASPPARPTARCRPTWPRSTSPRSRPTRIRCWPSTRRCWRCARLTRRSPRGSYENVAVNGSVMSFQRRLGSERMVVAINYGTGGRERCAWRACRRTRRWPVPTRPASADVAADASGQATVALAGAVGARVQRSLKPAREGAQTFCRYSRIVRSTVNAPMPAMLRSAMRGPRGWRRGRARRRAPASPRSRRSRQAAK